MPCFESKVSRGQWEFTQWNREGEREREEWKEGRETTANRLRGEKIESERHCRTNSSFTLGGREEACWEDQMTANTGGEGESGRKERRHPWSLSQPRNPGEERNSLLASWERVQVFSYIRPAKCTAMRSGYEARGRRRFSRASGQRRGAGHVTPARTPAVFCCQGSSAAGEERYLENRRSCHR